MGGVIEYVCEHGVGHPTLVSARRAAKKIGADWRTLMVHGCCGCCMKTHCAEKI